MRQQSSDFQLWSPAYRWSRGPGICSAGLTSQEESQKKVSRCTDLPSTCTVIIPFFVGFAVCIMRSAIIQKQRNVTKRQEIWGHTRPLGSIWFLSIVNMAPFLRISKKLMNKYCNIFSGIQPPSLMKPLGWRKRLSIYTRKRWHTTKELLSKRKMPSWGGTSDSVRARFYVLAQQHAATYALVSHW